MCIAPREDNHLYMQSTCSGSGIQSLLPVYTEAFGPVSTNPGVHVYVMNCPCTGGCSDPMTTQTGPCNNCVGR